MQLPTMSSLRAFEAAVRRQNFSRAADDLNVTHGAISRQVAALVRHEVEATEEGFLYDGRRWESLSIIARSITGTRWNGPRFFGLRAAA